MEIIESVQKLPQFLGATLPYATKRKDFLMANETREKADPKNAKHMHKN